LKGHRLAVATGIVFFVSLAFPVAAGLSQNTDVFPRVWGILDVVIAFILTALAIVTAALFDRAVTEEIRQITYRIYRILVNVILILLVVFFLAGDHIKWSIFLPGLAWRAWLLFYALPAWLAAFRSNRVAPQPGTGD
jgi:hypothetical protein